MVVAFARLLIRGISSTAVAEIVRLRMGFEHEFCIIIKYGHHMAILNNRILRYSIVRFLRALSGSFDEGGAPRIHVQGSDKGSGLHIVVG